MNDDTAAFGVSSAVYVVVRWIGYVMLMIVLGVTVFRFVILRPLVERGAWTREEMAAAGRSARALGVIAASVLIADTAARMDPAACGPPCCEVHSDPIWSYYVTSYQVTLGANFTYSGTGGLLRIERATGERRTGGFYGESGRYTLRQVSAGGVDVKADHFCGGLWQGDADRATLGTPCTFECGRMTRVP